MGRISFPFLLVIVCIAAVADAVRVPQVLGDVDDSIFERMKLAPSYASLSAPSYSSGPASGPIYEAGYDFVPYLTSSLAENPDQWPEKYPSTTTVEEAFGADAEQVYGSVSLLDGVSAKGEDGYSQLLKEGVAALLNAVDKHFNLSEEDVKKSFSFKTSLSSEGAASEQAHKFQDANMLYVASHT